MPHDSAETLAERLLVLTLALGEANDPQDLGSLFAERARVLSALESGPLPEGALAKLEQVQQAEKRVLQVFAFSRAQIVRDIGDHASARKLPQTYAMAGRSGKLVDSAG